MRSPDGRSCGENHHTTPHHYLTSCIRGTLGEVYVTSPLKPCGMFRKAQILPCNGLLLLARPITLPPPFARPRLRLYATAHGDFTEKDLSWPSTSSFTPYEVFGQSRGAPYSKHRFYELVKIYHPDRPCNNHPLCKDISPEVRLQRYRIVVSAHEILSDPTRRAAYDHSGTGWNLNPAISPSYRPPSAREHNPIYSNATWEDWERWYHRHDQKQETVVDHKTFVTFVVLLFFMGAAVQASWFTQVSTGYEDRLRDINEQSTRFLTERRKNTVNQMTGSDAKVQHFLIRRDPSGTGLKGEEEGVYQKVLSPRSNGSTGEKDEAEGGGPPTEDKKTRDPNP
ncbi:hypothetical protein BJX70DRAFT_364588 [Aspergillus crustosus]